MFSKAYFFTSEDIFRQVALFKTNHDIECEFLFCPNLASLLENLVGGSTENSCLISFGIGEVIPNAILKKFSLAINIHGASPDYPGRDPHHYAAYDNVNVYGATAHLMEEKVDAGSIIDVELAETDERKNAIELLDLANACGLKLLNRLLKTLFLEQKPFIPLPIQWGEVKRKRKDLEGFCNISPYVSKEEIDRKYKAFQEGISHKNLFVDLQGYRFKFEEKIDRPDLSNDFTEAAYKNYLDKLLESYKFSLFTDDLETNSPIVLWRHDVDVSMHRAFKLAQIEANLGIRSTYFIMLSNWFYDIRDRQVYNLICAIREMGHVVGLHFDVEYVPTFNAAYSMEALSEQKIELEKILRAEINVFSYHNPALLGDNLAKDFQVYGMVNVYSERFVRDFKYCSDSNGLWRFDKLGDLINPSLYPKLHILTHPEWWTLEILTPREKIKRALNGRTAAVLNSHDNALFAQNRPNF